GPPAHERQKRRYHLTLGLMLNLTIGLISTEPAAAARASQLTRPSSSVAEGVFARTPKPRTPAASLRGTRSFGTPEQPSGFEHPQASYPHSSRCAGPARLGPRSGNGLRGRDRRACSPVRDQINALMLDGCRPLCPAE